MSQSVGRIDLDVGLNYNTFQRELKGIKGMVSKLTKGALPGAVGLFAGGMIVNKIRQIATESLELASGLKEVQNVVDVTFKDMSKNIDEFAEGSLDKLGLSELAAKKYSSAIGAMLKSSGIKEKDTLQISKGVTSMAADFASFYNLDTDDMFAKIQSGLSGEVEPLKRLGINLNATNLEAYALSQGIDKAWESMSQAEQTILRYNYLLSVTKDAQGDFSRTYDSWANQSRIFGEQIKIIKGLFGELLMSTLLPLLQSANRFTRSLINMKDAVVEFFNDSERSGYLIDLFENLKDVVGLLADAFKLLVWLLGDTVLSSLKLIMIGLVPMIKAFNFLLAKIIQVADAFRSFIKLVFGIESVSEPAKELNDNLYEGIDLTSGYGDALDEAGDKADKAGKKAKGSLAAFDQLNTLMFPKNSGDKGDGGADNGNLPTPDLGGIESGEKDLKLKLDIEMPKIPPLLPLPTLFWPIPPAVLVNEFNFAFSQLRMPAPMPLPIPSLQPLWGMVPAFDSVFKLLKNLVKGFSFDFQNNLAYVPDVLKEMLRRILESLGEFQGQISVIPLLSEMMKGLFTFPQEMTSGLDIIRERLKGFGNDMVEEFNKWKNTATDVGAAVAGGLVGGFLVGWGNLKGIFKGLTDDFIKFFQDCYNTYSDFDVKVNNLLVDMINGILGQVGDFFSGAGEMTLNGLNTIKTFWEEHKTQILVIVGLLGVGVIAALTGLAAGAPVVVGGMASVLIALFVGVKDSFAETGEELKNDTISKFQLLKEGLSGKWGEIKDEATRKWQDIARTIKDSINSIFDSINHLISSWNGIKFSVPKVNLPFSDKSFGGGTISVPKVPMIPKLATGGIIKAPTLAMIGENNKKEAVIPLENSDFIDSFARKVAKIVDETSGNKDGGSDGPVIVVLKLDETELGRATIKSIRSAQRQSGNPLIIM